VSNFFKYIDELTLEQIISKIDAWDKSDPNEANTPGAVVDIWGR
jgi:hypothetical protein